MTDATFQPYFVLTLLPIRIVLVTFGTYFTCIIAIFMAKLCCSTSVKDSVHEAPFSLMIILGFIPGVARICGLLLIILNTTADSMHAILLDPTDGLDPQSLVSIMYRSIDALLIICLDALLCFLSFYTYTLWKKKNISASHQYLKWQLASSMAIFFFLIAFTFSIRYTVLDTLDFFETPFNGPEIRFWVAVVQFAFCFAPRDSIGLLMCLAYIRCRSVYFASLEHARSPRVVIVSSKDFLHVPSKLIDSSKDAISSIPSRPPALNSELEARNFLNLSLQSTLGSDNYRPPSGILQSRSTFHPESFAAFDNDPGTDSQLQAMFGRMEEMPRFDSCHLDDLF